MGVMGLSTNTKSKIALQLQCWIYIFYWPWLKRLLLMPWSVEKTSLSITKDQELQQSDFSIAIGSVHTGNTQLGPSDKATCELWMSLPTSTSYLNNAVCVVSTEISKWCRGCEMTQRLSGNFPTEINKKITREILSCFLGPCYRSLSGAR